MTSLLHPYDIKKESSMLAPQDFHIKSRVQHVDKVFEAQITNVIHLTEKEKLFHIRIIDDTDRERFTFLPGQFVMLEVPGYGEVPISISSSVSQKGFIELCIRKAGVVTNVLHKAQRGARVGIRGPFGSHFPMEQMNDHNILLDLRKTKVSYLSMEDAMKITVEFMQCMPPDFKNKIANVIPDDTDRKPLAKKFEICMNIKGVNYKFFTDFEDAIEWLADAKKIK